MQWDIPAPVRLVLDRLEENGYAAYVVGGCVRDLLMGRAPHDWDVTTSARPEETKVVFSDLRVIETGLKHGTVTVRVDDRNVEVTTFRIDGAYTDARHPDSVTFSDRVEEDLARRDFTVNAMAYSPKRGLVDAFDGRGDLEKKVLRCVGDPDERFGEDALRILRAARFAATLGFSVAPEVAEAMRDRALSLTRISAERVASELLKLLRGKDAERVLVEQADVICTVVPELRLLRGFEQKGAMYDCDAYTQTARCVGAMERDALLRLAMLLLHCGKPATHVHDAQGNSVYKNLYAVSGVIAQNVLRRLKLSNDMIFGVSTLIVACGKPIPDTRKRVKQDMNELGELNYVRLMKIKRAEAASFVKGTYDISDKLLFAYRQFDEVLVCDEPYTLKTLAVTGRDVRRFCKTPEGVGQTLQLLLDAVLDDPAKNERETLIRLAKEINDTAEPA